MAAHAPTPIREKNARGAASNRLKTPVGNGSIGGRTNFASATDRSAERNPGDECRAAEAAARRMPAASVPWIVI
jgi:hypothetical protein